MILKLLSMEEWQVCVEVWSLHDKGIINTDCSMIVLDAVLCYRAGFRKVINLD